MQQVYKKTKQIFFGVMIVQLLLVATHLGEFWPFSIFPMFSKAGKTWTRSLVRDVSQVSDSTLYWEEGFSVDDLPGNSFAMDEVAINTNDVSNTIEKVAVWDEQAKNSIRHLFQSGLQDRKLMVYRVNGSFEKDANGNREVSLKYTPFILLSESAIVLNQKLITK